MYTILKKKLPEKILKTANVVIARLSLDPKYVKFRINSSEINAFHIVLTNDDESFEAKTLNSVSCYIK